MPIIREQKQAADRLGITARQLRNWQKEPGFPDCSSGYDLERIAAWREQTARKGSEESDQARKIKLAIAGQKLRQEKARADKAERENEIAKGNILPRDEWEHGLIEMVTVCRDALMAIPRELCRFVPKKYHKRLQTEGEKMVRRHLDHLARSAEDGPPE